MRKLRVVQALLSLAIGCAGAIVLSDSVYGTPEIAQSERLGCLVCHTAMGKADLNARGRYYRAERTLEGYVDPDAPVQPAPEDPEESRPEDGPGGQNR